MSYRLCWLLASRIRRERVPSWSCSQAVTVTFMTYTIAVCTVEISWWWTEGLSETCRVLFQKWIWEITASRWFYNKNISRCTVIWKSNSHVVTVNTPYTQYQLSDITILFILKWKLSLAEWADACPSCGGVTAVICEFVLRTERLTSQLRKSDSLADLWFQKRKCPPMRWSSRSSGYCTSLPTTFHITAS